MSSAPPYEQMLVELSRWLARVLQYSASHPSCVAVAKATHGLAVVALETESPLQFGVLKDDLMLGDVALRHRAIRGRLAPYLHERGVLLLRFARGVTLEELTSFVEVMALPATTIFDGGGLSRLLAARSVARVQIEEIGHDITTEEREEHRRRKQFRSFFSDMLRNLLARRADLASIGDRVVELLEHPDIAVAILEERSSAGLAEAVAGLALMVKQTQARTGAELQGKLGVVVASLSPAARVHVLLGAPSLVGEFREALLWAVDGLDEDAVADFVFPSVRARYAELDDVLYALGVVVRKNQRRLSALRRVALSLFNLAIDEPETFDVLGALAKRPTDHHSFRQERACLADAAERALAARALALPAMDAASAATPATDALAQPGGQRSVTELLTLAAGKDDFDRLCARLPSAALALVDAGSVGGVIGILDGLGRVAGTRHAGAAEDALRAVATSPAVPVVLRELDRASAAAEAEELGHVVATVKTLVSRNPAAVFEQLVRAEGRKMRRILLDALPLAGPSLLPILRSKLQGASWFVARNIALLLPRVGGEAADLKVVARHPNEKVRVEVVRALRAVPDETAAMDVLAGYLTDASHEVRQTALASLKGDRLGAEAIRTLEQVAADDHGPEDLRRRVIQTLGRCPDGAAARALYDLLQPRGLIDLGAAAALRELAATSLRGCPAEEAAKLFADGLHSPVRRVRKACERAAGGPS